MAKVGIQAKIEGNVVTRIVDSRVRKMITDEANRKKMPNEKIFALVIRQAIAAGEEDFLDESFVVQCFQ